MIPANFLPPFLLAYLIRDFERRLTATPPMLTPPRACDAAMSLRRRPQSRHCTVGQIKENNRQNSHPIIHFRMSEGVSEVSE